MSNSMLINVVNQEESRVAIVSEGRLQELSIETAANEQIESNIYRARIVKVVAGLDAVFVDYGAARNGFLAVSDIRPEYFEGDSRDPDRLRKGQPLMVQVRKGEIGQKGAALTTYVSLPGRYTVLMPHVNKRGVSRKIEDEAVRKQLRQTLDDSNIPDAMGFIMRTAAVGRTKQDLTRDAGYLVRLWKQIESEFAGGKRPALLYQDSDIVIRTIRDYFEPSIHEVWVDDKVVYDQVRSFFQAVMPWHQKRVRYYQGKTPLFSKHNLEQQIASIYEKRVPLPSGGSIVIEQTEALVSIDVNSGKSSKGKDIEETALITNLEAAKEAARQLRLRDRGGLVVIDFIDMRSTKNRNQVRKELQKVLKDDKARTDTGTISKFGLLELSRQRIRPASASSVTRSCPVCNGTGSLRSVENFSLFIVRLLHTELGRAKAVGRVSVGVPMDAATFLLNRKQDKIAELAGAFGAELLIFPEPTLQPNQYFIEYRSNGNSRVDTNLPASFDRSQLRTAEGLPEAVQRSVRPFTYVGDDSDGSAPEAEPPEDQGQGDGSQAQGEEAAGDKPSKKRRRRRRRKKSGDSANGAGTDTRSDDQPAPQQEPEADAPTQDAAAQVAATGEGEGGEQPSSSSKRRRRRRRKSPGGESQSGAATNSGGQPAAAASAAQPEAEAEAAGDGEAAGKPSPATKPRQRRRGKKSSPAGAQEDGRENATSSAAQPGAETTPTPAAADTPEGSPESQEGKQDPPRSSRSRGRAAPKRIPVKAPQSAKSDTPAAAADETPSASGEKAESPPKRSRRTRKTPPENAPQEAAQEQPEEAKPARRKRTTRPKASKQPAAEEGPEEPAPEAKPKRKRAARPKTRKPPAAKDEASDQPEAAPETKQDAGADAPARKKPTRKRSPRRAPQADPEAADGSGPDKSGS